MSIDATPIPAQAAPWRSADCKTPMQAEMPSGNRLQPGLLEAVLDCLEVPVVLATSQQAIYVNRAARSAMACGATSLEIRHGRLVGRPGALAAVVQRAVEDAVNRGTHQLLELPAGCQGLASDGRGDEREMVAVVPLQGQAEANVAMVTLARRGACSALVARLYCAHHRLTSAEADVLCDLLAGQDPGAIARRKGVAISTVRTQIARIREKARVGGIRELISATSQLPPIASLAT